MGSRKEEKKKKRKNNNNNASSSTHKKRRRSQIGFKDMRMLPCNDEPFRISLTTISDIIDTILSRKTPTPKTYRQWDEYAISFYLKMCICFGVNYQHLEATDCGNKPFLSSTSLNKQEEHMECTQPLTRETSLEELGHMECAQPSTKEISYKELLEQLKQQRECTQPLTKQMSYEERLYEIEHMKISGRPTYLRKPFKMGYYSTGTTPDRIPYHLYLLVKEAVDIMRWHNDTDDLMMVEEKIRFFRTYFRAHLPTGWKYNRDDASSLIVSYDTMGGHGFPMAGYTPFEDWAEEPGFDPKTYLSARQIVNIMRTIHSRKTPTFWGMSWHEISFYCKLCSCFGIVCYRLETASEDDVCLMKVGRND